MLLKANEVCRIASEECGKPVSLSAKAVKDAARKCRPHEWHHTSSWGNRTNYYSAEDVADVIAKELCAVKSDNERKHDMIANEFGIILTHTLKDGSVIKSEPFDVFRTSSGYAFVVDSCLFRKIEPQAIEFSQILNEGLEAVCSNFLSCKFIMEHRTEIIKASEEYNAKIEEALNNYNF